MDSQEKALAEEQITTPQADQQPENVNEVAEVENAESSEVTETVERKQYDTKKDVLERVREIAHSDEAQ